MNFASIRDQLRERVSEQIDIQQQGENRFIIKTPFRFEDGDHFVMALKPKDNGWIITDEASTIMHLSYWMDTDALSSGNRKAIIDSSLSAFGVENLDGELIIPVVENRFGDALFDFVQALTKVTDVSFLSREVVRSTFMEDLKSFIKSKVSEERLQINWTDERDTQDKYPVDFRVNHMKRPLFIYGLPNEDKVKDATISLLTFERWNLKFRSVGVFENVDSIPKKSANRFMDVIGKQYSNLNDNRERLANFLEDALAEG